MKAPGIWTVKNRATGDFDHLSDRQLWDVFRAHFPELHLGPWEQQDAARQAAWYAFLHDIDPQQETYPKENFPKKGKKRSSQRRIAVNPGLTVVKNQ